jgi:superfamily II DNA/RNA helicase
MIGSKIRAEPLRVIDEFGYRTPTPNKMASMLLSLQGSDDIDVTETGSGKEADVAAGPYVRLRVILLIGEW